jgi:exodeoxyribonuclease VII large subunit
VENAATTFLPEDGAKVTVEGSIAVYPPRGSYQIDCLTIHRQGKGDLHAKFEDLKQKLESKAISIPAAKATARVSNANSIATSAAAPRSTT